MQQTGMLYLCATPIGNLEDITLRVLRVLREADAIWAEDTRHTRNLLNHYEIHKRMVSCHTHNVKSRLAELETALHDGQHIAYCTDAGMPGISDPGAELVSFCLQAALPFTVLPGASAVLTAAILSGLPNATFTFFGFLPREKKQRRATMERMAQCEELLLLYESPLRLPATLRELEGVLGQREAVVMRELTKLHEECARGTLEELAVRFAEPPRGECVIAIAGKANVQHAVEQDALDAALQRLGNEGFSTKDAASAVHCILGVSKRAAYARALELDARMRPHV